MRTSVNDGTGCRACLVEPSPSYPLSADMVLLEQAIEFCIWLVQYLFSPSYLYYRSGITTL